MFEVGFLVVGEAKQDGLRLVVSIAVDLLEKVPVEGRRFPRKQSVEEGRCQPSGKSP